MFSHKHPISVLLPLVANTPSVATLHLSTPCLFLLNKREREEEKNLSIFGEVACVPACG